MKKRKNKRWEEKRGDITGGERRGSNHTGTKRRMEEDEAEIKRETEPGRGRTLEFPPSYPVGADTSSSWTRPDAPFTDAIICKHASFSSSSRRVTSRLPGEFCHHPPLLPSKRSLAVFCNSKRLFFLFFAQQICVRRTEQRQ